MASYRTLSANSPDILGHRPQEGIQVKNLSLSRARLLLRGTPQRLGTAVPEQSGTGVLQWVRLLRGARNKPDPGPPTQGAGAPKAPSHWHSHNRNPLKPTPLPKDPAHPRLTPRAASTFPPTR